jgi:hypothetical protein
MGTLPTKICRLEAMSKGYPAHPPGRLGTTIPTVPANSPKELSPTNGQPIDKAYRGRAMRVFVPIWAVLMVGNFVWAIAGGYPMVIASILLAGALLGLVRLRWPRDTWPAWLFSYKP